MLTEQQRLLEVSKSAKLPIFTKESNRVSELLESALAETPSDSLVSPPTKNN